MRRISPSTNLYVKYIHFSSYATAKDWDALSYAVSASTSGSLLDEMIYLRHAASLREPTPKSPFINSNHIYWRVEDIAASLTYGPVVPSRPWFTGNEILGKIWSDYNAASRRIHWGPSNRQLLGALGYVLLYLEGALDFVSQTLKKYTVQRNDIGMENLLLVYFFIFVGLGFTLLSSRLGLDTVARLGEAFQPTSKLHQRSNTLELGREAMNVKKLMKQLPRTIQREYADDLDLALEALSASKH